MVFTVLATRVLVFHFLFFVVQFSLALEASNRSWQLSAPGKKAMAISISSGFDEPGRLTLSIDKNNIFERPMNRGELYGVCLEKSTDFPSFIVAEVLEGVGLEQVYVLRKDNSWQLITLPSVGGVGSVDELEGCTTAASNWSLDGTTVNCECDFSGVIRQQLQWNNWHDLLGEFQTGLYLNASAAQLNPRIIEDAAQVDHLVAEARANEVITFEETVNNRHWVIIEHRNPIYGSVSLGMFKQDKQWSVWYYVRGNSKSFNAISDIDRPSENLLSGTLCIAGCDWWGSLASVDIALDTLMFAVVERE
ncbi:hypothetical protein HNQ57_001821 [Zhongshania antarctica]|uniref:Uncharacterized protein n=1 Tax=Zhongshania antarctica TaxID=641702 RepID=A0A840R554_9GAMM|nr:hypothetical protein [Zhongshania antarctica]MBB5187552.1 hypothetical protein [Zhongshania antarctica]